MKITAFAASNSRTSINLELVKAALKHLNEYDITILDINDFEMPIYSEERNKEGIPQLALNFNQQLNESDAIIIGLAEHNGTFSTAFKNIFDWGSRADMKLFKDKPMLLLATSPGARGGINVMQNAKNIFPFFGGNIQSSYILPNFQEHFSNGYINSTEHQVGFEQAVQTFKEALV